MGSFTKQYGKSRKEIGNLCMLSDGNIIGQGRVRQGCATFLLIRPLVQNINKVSTYLLRLGRIIDDIEKFFYLCNKFFYVILLEEDPVGHRQLSPPTLGGCIRELEHRLRRASASKIKLIFQAEAPSYKKLALLCLGPKPGGTSSYWDASSKKRW